jgi:hypothetical protein
MKLLSILLSVAPAAGFVIGWYFGERQMQLAFAYLEHRDARLKMRALRAFQWDAALIGARLSLPQ